MIAMVQRTVTVTLDDGLHMRPCQQIVQRAAQHPGDVRIRYQNQTADAKSLSDLLGLAAEKGTTLVVEADGHDAEVIADQLESLFSSHFNLRREN